MKKDRVERPTEYSSSEATGNWVELGRLARILEEDMASKDSLVAKHERTTESMNEFLSSAKVVSGELRATCGDYSDVDSACSEHRGDSHAEYLQIPIRSAGVQMVSFPKFGDVPEASVPMVSIELEGANCDFPLEAVYFDVEFGFESNDAR